MAKSSAVSTLLQAAAVAATVAAAMGVAAIAGVPMAIAALVLTVVASVQNSAYQRQKARHQFNNSLTDRQVMTMTFDGVRSRVYGRARNVDGVLFKGTRGDKSQFYTLFVAVAGHEVDAIERVYFNDIPLTLDANGYALTEPYGYTRLESQEAVVTSGAAYDVGASASLPTVKVLRATGAQNRGGQSIMEDVTFSISGSVITLPFAASPSNFYRIVWQANVVHSKARVRAYLGAATQDLSGELAARFPGLINSSHKFSGIAGLLVDLEYDENAFPAGLPNITALIRGAKVLDPRTGVTNWSENPALCIRDWALYANGGACASDEIHAASIITAANACDVSHTYTDSTGASTTVPLFRCGYVARLDVSPEVHLAEMVEAMAGKWGWAGGLLKVRAGVYAAPVAALDDSWMSSTGGMREIVPDIGMTQLANTYRVTIADASANYAATQLPALAPPAYLAEDGVELPMEIEMGAVTFAPQAQSISGISLRDMRAGMTVKWPCSMMAWPLELFDVVTLTSARYGWSAKQFEVVGWDHSPQTGVGLTLKEYDASIFNPDSVFSVADQVANTAMTKPWVLPTITGLSAESGTAQLLVNGDGTVVSRIKLSFDDIESQAVLSGGAIEVQYSNGGDGWQSESWTGASGAIYISGVTDGAAYLIKARVRSRLAVGDWCQQIVHTVVGKSEPPSDVAGIWLAGTVAEWAPIPDVDLAGYQLRAASATAPNWSAATPIHTGLITEAKINLIGLISGTQTVLVKAFDMSGNESATAASTIVNLTLNLSGNLWEAWPQATAWPGVVTDGSIYGGALVADDTGGLFWGSDSGLFWGGANAGAFWSITYKPMQYQVTVVPTSAGTLAINQTIAGEYLIEYRRDDVTVYWTGDASDLFWDGADTDPFWPAFTSPWQGWTGSATVQPQDPWTFRVTVLGGSTQGQISEFTPFVDVPTIREIISGFSVAPGGSRPAITSGLRVITGLQLTVVDDGGSAVGAKQIDTSLSPGPLLACYDISGSSVAGTVNAEVIGY